MKVVIEGVLQCVPGQILIRGWCVESDQWYPTLNEGKGGRALALCVLVHIGQRLGIELVEASAVVGQAEEVERPLPECFDAQREALDAIAVAKWREQGE